MSCDTRAKPYNYVKTNPYAALLSGGPILKLRLKLLRSQGPTKSRKWSKFEPSYLMRAYHNLARRSNFEFWIPLITRNDFDVYVSKLSLSQLFLGYGGQLSAFEGVKGRGTFGEKNWHSLKRTLWRTPHPCPWECDRVICLFRDRASRPQHDLFVQWTEWPIFMIWWWIERKIRRFLGGS